MKQHYFVLATSSASRGKSVQMVFGDPMNPIMQAKSSEQSTLECLPFHSFIEMGRMSLIIVLPNLVNLLRLARLLSAC